MHEWNDTYEKTYSFSLLFCPTCFVMKGGILSILGFWKYALVFCVHQLLPTAPRLGHNFHCRSYLLLSSSLRSSPSTSFIIIASLCFFLFKCKIFSYSRGWMQNLNVLNLSVFPYLKVSCLWSLTQHQQRAIFKRHVSQVLPGISTGRSSDSTSIWEK